MPKREGRSRNDTASSRSAKNEAAAKVRRGYEAAEHPEPQGDGDPGTEPVEVNSGDRKVVQPG